MSKVPPRPGADTWPQVLEAAERLATSARAGTSRAYREAEATRLLVGHVVDLLRSWAILLESEHCVLLNGADEEGAALQPGVGAGAAWRMDRAAPLGAVEVAGGANAGGASAGADLSGAEGAVPSEAPQVHPTEPRSKDDRELIGLTTSTHPPEVRVCLPFSRVYEVGLVWHRGPRWP